MVAAGLTVGSVLNALKPVDVWGWLLYIIIILDVVTMFLQKQSNLQITIFLALSIMAALINELGNNNLGGTGAGGVFDDMLQTRRLTFANWMVMIVMFVFPLVVAGMTKSGKSRLPAILAAIGAMIYLVLRYALAKK